MVLIKVVFMGAVFVLLSLFAVGQNTNSNLLFPINIDHEFPNPEASFKEVMALILDNYYTTDLTEKDLYWASIQGMLRHISPPENPELAVVWTPEQYESILNSLKGVEVSIGIKSSFNSADGSLTVTKIIEDSPADGSLLPFDRILRINDLSLKDKTTPEINDLLNGEAGTTVKLTVIRDLDILEIELTRQNLAIKNLEVHLIPGRKTALIIIRKVTLGIADELRDELDKLNPIGYTNLILDLRNNPGGVLNEGLNIANLFLKRNDIITRTMSRSSQTSPIVSNIDQPMEYNIITLINKQTASASEIVVAALRDHNKATMIGSRTYGKSVIEETFKITNDYHVKFIKSAMYSPKGNTWQTKGLLPDFLVEQSNETYLSLSSLHIDDRLRKDLYYITALKLID